MFTPSNPTKATNPIVTALIGCPQIANVRLATLEHHIVSKSLAIQDCQITSNNLAIQEGQIASNQDDACPCHLAMLVMSC
jgi:hypothetical protein